jgi:Fe-S cluster biogenesis protein NfuA
LVLDFSGKTDYNKIKEFLAFVFPRGMLKGVIFMREQVEEVLGKLRPFLLRDGGDVELVNVDDGVVRVRLMGACGSCPSSTITLKAGIERALFEEVPGFKELEQVF